MTFEQILAHGAQAKNSPTRRLLSCDDARQRRARYFLFALARYIHLNPVRAGLCKRADDYAWSSYRAYAGDVTIPWLYRQEILGRFSDDEARAQALLRDFSRGGVGEPRQQAFHQGSHLGQILGDDDFAEQAFRLSGRAGMKRAPSLQRVVAAVCEAYGMDAAALRAQGKGRAESEARAMAAWIVQQTEGVTLTALAELLGRDLSAISQAAGRLRKRMESDQELREKAEKIAKSTEIPISQA